MVVKARQGANDSAKAEVGEIDTSAPFESVKAAVTLFGEGALPAEKLTEKKLKPPHLEKRVSKEKQLHLAQKELNKYKEQLQSAETTKAQALDELEKARKAISDLTGKLNCINESKESATKATEACRLQAKELEAANSGHPVSNGTSTQAALEDARERYSSVINELDGAKQELRRMRQEFSASMDARACAIQHATDAAQAIQTNTELAHALTKEITAANDSLARVKHAHLQALEEHTNIMKSAEECSSDPATEQKHKKLEALQKELLSETADGLEAKLTAKMAEVGMLQKQLASVKASQLDSLANITADLTEAKGVLYKVAEEEQAQRNLLESLKAELENVRKEHKELEAKEAEAENIAAELHVKLQSARAELDAALSSEAKGKGASDELLSTLEQLSLETKEAKAAADQMRLEAEELKGEAESMRLALEEAEKRLRVALREAEEAKAAEANALDQINLLSEKTKAARASTSEHGANITISKEEYDSLNGKVNDADSLAGMKVAAAMAQVEAVKASEKEALQKLESIRKEMEDTEVATNESNRRAQMADAARKAVEGELKRWREREQKKWAAAELPPQAPVIQNKPDDVGKVLVAAPAPGATAKVRWSEKTVSSNNRKIERSSTLKKMTFSSFSGIFHKKKTQAEVGMPSYLPGEKVM
ncbi:WEB family protein [Nymphaea thermarum]|nr:WEB family protein [Nymphaea thermarum]